MKKIYIVRKYVVAESADEAIRISKRKPVDDCWAEDDTHKELLKEIIKTSNKGIGFTKNT
jgi:hypothetical protein